MSNKKGSLSINSENIFPIIKKWLYSDHDIFLRELVSNACDAITKLRKLDMIGEFEEPEDNHYRVDVKVSPENKTIKVIDNGLGMTADEVEEYINQIAFSGAEDFLAKYKDKTNEDQIIGHFGLGFYSAFMVADKVTIQTLSYKEDAVPVYWECDGGTEFSMSDGERTERGTEITLYLGEDSVEFANEFRVREILNKYCSFMPEEIYFTNEDVKEEETEEKEEKPEEPKPINDTVPLWAKHPNECTEEEYKEFYRKVFMDFKEPLFWIHLNMDYPFNLKGILYFPKINYEYESIEGTIKLYNNQVFIADNIKEVIPEFLLLLKGVIDCPDLPLNVSRSALQNDGFVKKISDYITKKVADKLAGLCKTEKESYEKYWDDISPFIKFGCLKDEKFNKKMKDYILFKNLEKKYITLPEYLEAAKDKNENKVFYVTDEVVQSQYINMFKEQGMDAVYLTQNIDSAFITHLEQANQEVKFLRIDADVADTLTEEANEEEMKSMSETLGDIFKKALSKENLTIKVERLKNEGVSAMITLSEESRRMQEMMKMYNMGQDMDPAMFGMEGGETLILNANNRLVQYVIDQPEGEHTELICQHLYDLAQLSNRPLDAESMTKFIARSNEILGLLI
ncbi:molecular chaperone HtpG [Anaerostipes sp. 992a]|uniref:molecular chaperone HtpG n=1 Tax=Anaerostipes sp. 992a TaxID=1261637 RepID=UPI000952DB84|nr:molecular chaperone HtpG [Anaerostipes sp. 992a]OLR62790.1 molecular chaperone HtpG [Anaerostipes sp. 992a]